MVKLTATIVTLNEEKNVARAIESLRCCEEIIVVDSGSTDRTRTLATQRGARVIPHAWPGYAAQNNWDADQAANDWILSIDADEALSEELETELLTLKKVGMAADGYIMPRVAQYLGRWIRHSGWYPGPQNTPLRPAQKRAGWASMFMRAFKWMARLPACDPTCCTSPAIRFRRI